MRDLEKEGKLGIKKMGRSCPKVLIYDVDRDLKAEEIPGVIGMQNPEVGLEKGKKGVSIKPIFRRGPKDGNTTW